MLCILQTNARLSSTYLRKLRESEEHFFGNEETQRASATASSHSLQTALTSYVQGRRENSPEKRLGSALTAFFSTAGRKIQEQVRFVVFYIVIESRFICVSLCVLFDDIIVVFFVDTIYKLFGCRSSPNKTPGASTRRSTSAGWKIGCAGGGAKLTQL